MVDQAVVEAAIDELRPFLQADGFDLGLEELSVEGDLVVCLEAKPEACLECLVPDDILMQIIDSGVRRHASGVGRISLVRRGFEGLSEH